MRQVYILAAAIVALVLAFSVVCAYSHEIPPTSILRDGRQECSIMTDQSDILEAWALVLSGKMDADGFKDVIKRTMPQSDKTDANLALAYKMVTKCMGDPA